MNYSLSLQTTVVLPPNILDSEALIRYVHLAPYASTIKAPPLSLFVRAHTYIKHKWWKFWHPYLFGSIGVSNNWNPNIFIARWPLRPQCVHVYTLAYIWVWVWVWCTWDVCHVGCVWVCGAYFLQNIDSNL